MSSTIYGLTNYNITSPVSPIQMNPISNLIYGSVAGSFYARSVAKQAKSTMSSYLNSMKAPSPYLAKKEVTSTNSSAVSGIAKWNASEKTYGITVSKLATSQTDNGLALKSGNPSVFEKGTNTFAIKSNGITKTISFTVTEKETNKASLDKMAQAVNSAHTGVTASVVNDEKQGTSYLKLQSADTGKEHAFDIYDIKGNAVSASGADKISQNSQDAEYTLDGKKFTSSTNTIRIDNGKVEVTLNKADDKEVRLGVKTDAKEAEEAFKSLEADISKNMNRYNYVFQSTGKSSVSSGQYSGMFMDVFL